MEGWGGRGGGLGIAPRLLWAAAAIGLGVLAAGCAQQQAANRRDPLAQLIAEADREGAARAAQGGRRRALSSAQAASRAPGSTAAQGPAAPRRPVALLAAAVPRHLPSARAEKPGTARIIENYPGMIEVPAGRSVLLRLNRVAQRVAIADPEVADVVMVNPREILVNGHGRRYTTPSGETVIQEAKTSLIVWDKKGRADIRTLAVNKARSEQVELQVTVAELNRSAMERAGFDFRVFQGKVFIGGTPAKIATINELESSLTSPVPSGRATLEDTLNIVSDRLTFSVLDLNDNFLAFIELLQRESLARVLARPTLLARSGEEAHFRSGGEVPIPLVTNNQITVDFKEFGVLLDFTPRFTDDGKIDLRVSTELSQPDFSRGAQVGGFIVPTFMSRQTSTRVRLRPDQSLLISGLLREDETESVSKVPYLGDLPYLGALFRSTSFDHTRSELVVLVRPRVVTEQEPELTSLPTDRPPLSREEVRTKPDPHEVTRPRLFSPAPPRAKRGEGPPSGQGGQR